MPGLAVGHAHDDGTLSGVTVVLPNQRAVCGVDARGGAPGTRETEALDPSCLVDAVDAVVLSGGSVYGLDAASGVTTWLGARGRGFRLDGAQASDIPASPVVPAAILFDLANGGNKDWGDTPPYRELGIAACGAAASEFALGNAGAGHGAIAGNLKGGLGSASARLGPDPETALTVGALIAVNAVGSVLVPGTDKFWAAQYERDGEFGSRGVADRIVSEDFWAGTKLESGTAAPGTSTTIGVIATDAILTPAEARRIAIMAHDGLARAIRPVHTPLDGDTLFVLSTGTRELEGPRALALSALGALAADTTARAVARGVYLAGSTHQHQAYRDRF